MVTEVRHKAVQVAALESRSRVTIGAGSILAPTTEFLLEAGDAWLRSVGLLTEAGVGGSSGIEGLLDEVAAASLRRATRLREAGAAWRQVGVASLAAGDTSTAREAFQRALRSDPADRSAKLGLARTAFEDGQADEAKHILESVLADNPQDVDARVYLALAMAGSGDFEAALRCIEGLPIPPHSAGIFLGARGGIRFALKDVKGAISDLRKAVRLSPDWVHARNMLAHAELQLGRIGAAERHLREAIRTAPMNVDSHKHLVRLLVMQGRWGDVLASIDAFWDPEYAPFDLAHAAGIASLELGDFRSARDWLESAVSRAEIPERRAIALNNLAVAYTHLNQGEKAGSAFEGSVGAWPSARAIANRAKLFLDQGKASAAIEWVAEQGQLVGEEIDVDIARTIAVALTQLRRNEEAIDLAKRCVAAADADADSYALLSALYADGVEDQEAAVKVAQAGLSQWPGDPVLLNNLAYALLLGGRVEEAASYLESVDEAALGRERLVYVTATKGLAALWRGDFSEGRKLYDRAASFTNRDTLRARVRAKRDLETARTLLRLGRPIQESRRLLERAVKAGPAAEPYVSQAKRELRLLHSRPDE